MRIVHVVRQFHPSVGGLESAVLELAAAQIAEGHSVRVVTLDRLFNAPGAPKLPARERIAGAEVERIPFFGSPRYPLAPSVLRRLGDADIVHVHAIDFFFDFLAWTKPLHRKRLVVSTHGGFFHSRYAARFKRLYFATVTRLSLTWYDGVAAVSVADRELFGRLRRRGIVCIENGVNVVKYAGAASPRPVKTIAWIGRFAANKRLDRLMRFVAALRQHDGEWRLKIAGRPFDLAPAEVAGLARGAGISDAVEVFVSPADEEIRLLLGGCSVLASSSDYEGFGLVAAEGLSAGLLPVLSDIAVFRRLVEQTGAGMVLDFAQPERAAANFLARWPELAADYQRLRKASIEAAAAYDWRRVSRSYTSLYRDVLGLRRRSILNVPVRVLTRSEAVALLDRRFAQQRDTVVAFANANCLNKACVDARLRAALRDAVVVADGIGVDLASMLLFGSAFPHNLNGTDFTPHYLRATRHRYRVYLLGARPGVADRAAEVLLRICPGHRVVGCRDGYFPRAEDAAVAGAIRACRADLVLVAMGNPDQEIWLRDNLAASGCRLGLAVGGLFDFLAGEAQRAPLWLRAARLEWAYRLLRDPRRLWRRYLVGNPLFILRVLGQWWSGARV